MKTKEPAATLQRVFAYRFSMIHALYVQKALRKIRILDKLIDELAKGRPMAKILRQNA